MPTVADLNKLDSLANVGSTKFAGNLAAGSTGQARTRILFLVDSLNGQPEGFFKVYQGLDENFVSGRLPTTTGLNGNYLEMSKNCGDTDSLGVFLSAYNHDTVTAGTHLHNQPGATNTIYKARKDSSLTTVTAGARRRTAHCYLGGDSILTTGNGPHNDYWLAARQPDGGAWVAAPSAIQTAVNGICARRIDCQYLFPLNRAYNPNFKGVISVNGKVIVSGVIHGRVTVAATGNIIFGSNVTYYQGTVRDCTFGDIAGFFSGQSDIISNNTLIAPQTVNSNDSWSTSPAGPFHNYGPIGTWTGSTASTLTIHGFFLTLRTYGAERYDTGDDTMNDCVGSNSGRGCLFTFGGIIQGWRGAVTQGTGGGYTGFKKQYSYDACGATDPPPYYPTTGIFVKNRFYEMDPTHFDVAAWFAANQN
jgi:hypothetical protein